MHLEIQKFLASTPFDQAVTQLAELGVDVHVEELNGKQYVHLDYSIFGDRNSNMVKECRGLALEKDSLNIVRFGFHRFLNLDEEGRDPIDFALPLRYEEKADGSLIILSYFNNQWVCGTRGRIFPDATLNGFDITFPDLFWSIFSMKEYLDPKICYMFELCHPMNRVVIKYDPQIVLTGARDTETWRELNSNELDEIAEDLKVRRPKTYEFNTIKHCVEYINQKEFVEEGFVLVQWNERFGRYARVKIKSDAYKNLHNIVSSRSLGNMVRLVINGNRIMLNDFPEFQGTYDLIENIFKKFKREVKSWYDEHVHILFSPSFNGGEKERRKIFAQAVMKKDYGNICFGLADEKIKDMDEWFLKQDSRSGIKGLIERFGLKKIVGDSWNLY
jgi:hypothetical protein